MKLKKSLLALTTAATVAVAGSTAAVADDTDNGANNSSAETLAGNEKQDGTEDGDKGGDKPGTEPGKDDNKNESKPGKKDLAGSVAKFFGWDDKTSPVEKIATVGTLITTVAALVGGIVTLFNNFQKLGKLVK